MAGLAFVTTEYMKTRFSWAVNSIVAIHTNTDDKTVIDQIDTPTSRRNLMTTITLVTAINMTRLFTAGMYAVMTANTAARE